MAKLQLASLRSHPKSATLHADINQGDRQLQELTRLRTMAEAIALKRGIIIDINRDRPIDNRSSFASIRSELEAKVIN